MPQILECPAGLGALRPRKKRLLSARSALVVLFGLFLVLRVLVEIRSELRNVDALVVMGGDEAYVDQQQIEISLSGMDLLASRIANLGLCLCGALGYLHALARVRGFTASKVLYAILLGFGVAVLFITTERPLEVLTTGYVFAKLAPGTLLAIGIVFIGLDSQMWPDVRRYTFWIIMGLSLWTVFQVLTLRTAARSAAVVQLHAPLAILEIAAPLCLAPFLGRKWYGLFAIIPLGVLAIGGIMTQTRLTVLMAVLGVILFFPRGVWMTRRVPWLSVMAVMLAGGLSIVLLSRTTVFSEVLTRFFDRLTFDSRSGQFLDGPFFGVFFATFPWGVGYPAAYQYNGEGTMGLDCGYLNTMLVVGLPMMTVFLVFQFWPVVRAWFSRMQLVDLAACTGAMCFVVRMFSSTVPVLSPQFVVFCVLSGRCIALASASAVRRGDLQVR